MKRLFFTFTGFMAADWASDRIFKQRNKLDYGILNKYLGRKIGEPWWGTRLEHHVTLPFYLTVTDVISAGIWKFYCKRRNKEFTIKGCPLGYLFHCYAFVHLGVMAYVAHNAYLNPSVENKEKFILDHLAPTSRGSVTMLAWPFTEAFLGKIATALPSLRWLLMGATAGAIHFLGVKGIGFNDHLIPDSLTDLEKEWNNFVEKPDDEL